MGKISTDAQNPQGGNAEVPVAYVQLVPLAQAGEGQQAQSWVPFSFECHRARWTGHDLGRQEIECAACHALHWREELTPLW